jgi:hypothetical protein
VVDIQVASAGNFVHLEGTDQYIVGILMVAVFVLDSSLVDIAQSFGPAGG